MFATGSDAWVLGVVAWQLEPYNICNHRYQTKTGRRRFPHFGAHYNKLEFIEEPFKLFTDVHISLDLLKTNINETININFAETASSSFVIDYV